MKRNVIIILIILISIIAAFIILADDVMDADIIDNDGIVLGVIDASSIHKGEWSESYIETDLTVKLDRRLLEDQTAIIEIDPMDMKVGCYVDGKWHVLDSEASRGILSEPVFDEYFLQRTPPDLICSINGDPEFPIAEIMEWIVRLPDGNTTTEVEESNAIEFWTLPENSVMALGFDLAPDNLVIEDSSGQRTDVSGGFSIFLIEKRISSILSLLPGINLITRER